MDNYGQVEQIEELSVDSPLKEQVSLSEVSPTPQEIEKEYSQLVTSYTDRIAGFMPSVRSAFYAGLLAVSLSLPYTAVYAEGNSSEEVPNAESADVAPIAAPEYLELPPIENYFVPMFQDGTFSAGQPHEFSILTPEDELALDNAESVLPAVFRKGRGEEDLSIIGTINVINSRQVADGMYIHEALGPAHGFNEVYDDYKNDTDRYRYGVEIAIQGEENFYPMSVAFSPGYKDREQDKKDVDSDSSDEADIEFISELPLGMAIEDKRIVTRGELSVDPNEILDEVVYISGYPQEGYNLSDEGSIVRLTIRTTITEVNVSPNGTINFIKFPYPEIYSEGMSGGDITIIRNGKTYSIGTFRGINPGKMTGIGVPHDDRHERSVIENPAVPGADLSGVLEDDGVITFEDMKMHIWNTVRPGKFVDATKLINLIYELDPNEIRMESGYIFVVTNVMDTDITKTSIINTDTLKLEEFWRG